MTREKFLPSNDILKYSKIIDFKFEYIWQSAKKKYLGSIVHPCQCRKNNNEEKALTVRLLSQVGPLPCHSSEEHNATFASVG